MFAKLQQLTPLSRMFIVSNIMRFGALFVMLLTFGFLAGCDSTTTEDVQDSQTSTNQADTETSDDTPTLSTETPVAATETPIPVTPTPDFSNFPPEVARVFQAHRAIASANTFEMQTLQASLVSFSSGGAFSINVASGSAITSTSQLILGDAPNILSAYELVTEDYKINAESRFVDNTLHFQGQREVTSEDTEDLDPMPEGWVVIESPDDWPAIGRLLDENYFDEPYQFSLINEEMSIWLSEPSEVSIEQGNADDGTPAEIITLVWRGEVLESRWADQIADGFSISDESKIEITAAIDEKGRLIQFISNFDEELNKKDEFNNTFRQVVTSLTAVLITGIDAPIEPVNAP